MAAGFKLGGLEVGTLSQIGFLEVLRNQIQGCCCFNWLGADTDAVIKTVDFPTPCLLPLYILEHLNSSIETRLLLWNRREKHEMNEMKRLF